jgi:chitodextrinase
MFNGNASILLKNPSLVADSWLNLASAIWFFLTPQAPKPAMLHVIDRTWVPSERERAAGIGYGFGTTINVINGGIECGEQNKDKGQPVNRIRYWEGLSSHYEIPILSDEKNTCWQQTPYGSLNLNGASDVLYTNWDGNWKYYPDRPNGASFECELVGYQTAYSALTEGDYQKCVTNFYGSHANWPIVKIVDELPPSVIPPTTPDTDGVPAWSVTAVYTGGDQVSYDSEIYKAKWWTQGNQPDLSNVWTLVKDIANTTPPSVVAPTESEVAPPTESEVVTPTEPEVDNNSMWSSTKIYIGGDKVNYQGKTYEAKWWTTNNQPNKGDPWKKTL